MSEWPRLPAGARAALEEQWAGVGARALPCGASVVDASGAVIARGRNHAWDPPTGQHALEGTPIAHAELNALAGVSVDVDPADLTVWSTQRPCSMCSAALAFIGVGAVRYVAEDPSPAAQSDLDFVPLDDPFWDAVATVLFLHTGAVLRGAADGNLARHGRVRPAVAELVLELAADDRLGEASRAGVPLAEAIEPLRARLDAIA